MVRRPPTATRTDTLFPYTTLFRSARLCRAPRDAGQQSDAAVPQALTVRADRVDRSALYLALAGFTFRSIAKRNAIRESDAMAGDRSEEHTSELQSLMRISYAVFCLKKKRETDIKHSHLHR